MLKKLWLSSDNYTITAGITIRENYIVLLKYTNNPVL